MSLSYSYNEISSPADWLELDYYSEDEDMVIDHISLYSTATGEELTGFQQYTGAGTVSLYNSGRYQLVDLASTEQSAVLCEFDEPVRYYLPGAAITEPEASGRYRFHDLLTGEEKELYDVGTDDATLAIYALDGTVRVFDRQTGVLLTDTAIDPVENQVRAHVYAENGWVWVAQDDNDNYVNTAIQICGPDGTHKTLDPARWKKPTPIIIPCFPQQMDSISTAAATGPAAAGCMTSWTAMAMSSWAGCAAAAPIMPTAPTACRRVCLPPARDFLMAGWIFPAGGSMPKASLLPPLTRWTTTTSKGGFPYEKR